MRTRPGGGTAAWIVWTPAGPGVQGSQCPWVQEIWCFWDCFLASSGSAPVRAEHGPSMEVVQLLGSRGPQRHILCIILAHSQHFHVLTFDIFSLSPNSFLYLVLCCVSVTLDSFFSFEAYICFMYFYVGYLIKLRLSGQCSFGKWEGNSLYVVEQNGGG